MPRVQISDVVLSSGVPVSGASVQVNVHSGAAASLFTTEAGGVSQSNPLTTDSTGTFGGVAAPAWVAEGTYDLVISGSGLTTTTITRDMVRGSNEPGAVLTTTGDIPYASSANTVARLAVGASTTVLHGGTTPAYSQIVNADVSASAAIALTKLAAIGATSTGLTVSAANTDLAVPAGLVNYETITTGGGAVRSIGIPTGGTGSLLTLKNSTAASYVTLNHQLAGGSGAQLSIIGSGNRYLAPAQSIQLVYDGTNWQEINRPAMEQICDLTLSGAQAAFDTNTILGGNIPQVYNHLLIELYSQASANVSYNLTFNNDTAGNYDHEASQSLGGVAQTVDTQAAAFIYCGVSSQTNDYFGSTRIDIPQYAGAHQKSCVVLHGGKQTQAAAGNNSVRMSAGFWRSTAAITRLAVTATNFNAGSRFTLYGVT